MNLDSTALVAHWPFSASSGTQQSSSSSSFQEPLFSGRPRRSCTGASPWWSWVSLGLGETIFRAFGCGRTSRFLSRLHPLRSVRLSFGPNRRARTAEATIPRVLVALVLRDLDVSLLL